MNIGYSADAEYAKVEAAPMPAEQKKQKVGFIKRWMLKAVKEAVQEERGEVAEKERYANIPVPRSLSAGSPSIDQPDRAIQFTVYNANGGRVIETRRYDRKTDRNSNGLYVITSEQDFGREIDKIITMEALKQ